MTSTPDEPATPLKPALPQPAPRAHPIAPQPIDGGILTALDEAVPAAAKPAIAGMQARTASGRRPGLVGRTAAATSTMFNLCVLSALGLATFSMDRVQSGILAALAVLPPDAAGTQRLATAPTQPVVAETPASMPVPAPSVPQQAPIAAATEPAAAVAPEAPPKVAIVSADTIVSTDAKPTDGAVDKPADTTTDMTAPPAAPTTVAAAPVEKPATTPQRTPPGLPKPAAAQAPPATTQMAAPSPLAAETEHVARFDSLIAPVRDAALSVEDATHLRDAMSSIANLQQTKALRDQLKDPAARKLIDWALARGGSGNARDIKAFAESNPAWPSHDMLVSRSEEQLFVSGGSVSDIKAFFDKGAPKTATGYAALASAYLTEGDVGRARELAAAAWRRTDLPSSLEAGFLARFEKLLTEDDHKARFDRYLIDNTRWTGDRADRAAYARRIVARLGATERQKAEARLAAYLREPAADALLAALPADAITQPKPDWGLAFQLAQWNRRGGRREAAWKIMRDVPTDAAVAGNLDEWWEERRVAAYDALKVGQPKIAYDLVRAPGDLTVNSAKDQAFLAGWIALNYLKDTKVAERHFAAFETIADGPLSRSKAGYWLARTFEADKQKGQMRAPLERAAKNIDTFYGQLARLELEPRKMEIKIGPPRAPSVEEAQQFNANELVRAAVLSRKSNLDPAITRTLLARLSHTLGSEAEQALLAHLAEALGDPQMAVRIGKSAVARGLNLLFYAYPINAMPAYPALRQPPEPALVLGITRQESEFDTSIVSGAGARGLMQVMNVTAQHVCRDYKIKCEYDRLGRDPPYNAMMATAYIGDRMDEFRGSYVLAVAGYNAGPNRVRQWLKEFGDPRTSQVDPVAWIHRIPFEETREYVQKVLSNLQIYRARLGHDSDALQLTADLHRGATGSTQPAATTTPASADN